MKNDLFGYASSFLLFAMGCMILVCVIGAVREIIYSHAQAIIEYQDRLCVGHPEGYSVSCDPDVSQRHVPGIDPDYYVTW